MGGLGKFATISPGLLGLMLNADDAEAMPRPQYMRELLSRLENKDFSSGMDFGSYRKGKKLRQLQKTNSSFTEGPLKISGRNIEKLYKKRVLDDHIKPKELVDGLNSVFHGTRAKTFAGKDGKTLMLVPGEKMVWKGLVAPHDDFSGFVTGMKYDAADAKKELKTLSGMRPLSHFPQPVKGSDTQHGRLSAVERVSSSPEKILHQETAVNVDPNLPSAFGGATGAGVPKGVMKNVDSRQNQSNETLREPGLGTPIFDPIDLLTAGFGVPGKIGKLLAMISEPFVAAGTDAALNGILGYFQDDPKVSSGGGGGV